MKNKLTATIILAILLALNAQGQVHWTFDPANVNSGQNAKLGIANRRSLNLITSDSARLVIDSTGRLRFTKLAGRGFRLVYVDSLGNFGARGGGGDYSDDPCENEGAGTT